MNSRSRFPPRITIESLEPRALLAITPVGGEFRVNTFITGDQFAPAIAADDIGNFVVVWASDAQDGSGPGVYAQRYNSSGVAQGSEFRINTFTVGVQSLPSVAVDADGDFVVTWTSVPADVLVQPAQDGSGAGVFARRYNAGGTPLDSVEFQVNVYTAGNQDSSRVAMDRTGNFVIAWNSDAQDGNSYGVYARRYNAAGVPLGTEFQVNQFTAGQQVDPDVAMDRDGDFVIAWTSGDLGVGQDGSYYGIYARRYNAAGAAQGSEFRVNTYTTDYQTDASVAIDTDGDFVIAWQSYGQDGSQYGVYAQRYNAAGTPQGSEFRVNTFTTGDQSNPAARMNARGDFAIVWSSAGQDGSGRGVYTKYYDAAGNVTQAEFRVNTTTANDQTRPVLAVNRNGDPIVAWQDGSSTVGVNGQDGSGWGIYAQRFVAPDQLSPTVTSAQFNYLTGQSLAFGFGENVSASLTTADIVLQNLTTSTTVPTGFLALNYNGGTNTATITFTGYPMGILPDGNYRATLVAAGITDAAGNALDGDDNGAPGGNYLFGFFVLAGDANRDRAVDITDLGILATNWQQSPRNFSQADFNYDGVVDISDLGILATNWQVMLPAPAFAVTAPAPAPVVRPARVAKPQRNSRLTELMW